MISAQDVAFYRERGYVVVEGVLSAEELRALRETTERLVRESAAVATHDDVYDLEPDHAPETPRVRRIKAPHRQDPVYARLVRHPTIIAILQQLLAPSIRFDTGKLNMKVPGGGAAVEWHQDWAFYPHTNDDLAAVGVMLDDCDRENGPLLVVPGSHRGPVYDHHVDGRFCGAIDPRRIEADVLSKAVALTGRAGSITIHHVRMLHGSAPNRSARPRRLLLNQYRAGDAWPLLGVTDWDEFNGQLITGEPSVVPRMQPLPVRLPLPPAEHQGSIYENQRALGARYFEILEAVG
jgi:ectoine hydroxylase-related dioxygenase (phytanoyl-CoA dioxygenase family)